MNNFFSCNLCDYYSDKYFSNSDQYVDYLLTMSKKMNKNVHNKNFIFIGHITHESYCFDDYGMAKYINLFDSFNKKGIKTILVLNSFYKDINFDRIQTTIHFMDFHIWLCWYLIIIKKISPVSPKWNYNVDKFLMLTGKPYFPNRIRLLWKLHNDKLLEKSIWSMFVHKGTFDNCKSLIPEINENEFASFVQTYNKNADGADIQYQKNSLHYLGIPYDVKLYSDALFRIVPETTFRTIKTLPMITEKTYITILNKLPFLLAADTGSLRWLNDKGFKTFEKYLPISNYNEIEDPEKRLDAIVENCKSWLYQMKFHKKIENDVEHNFKNICKIAQENVQAMEKFSANVGLGQQQPQDILLDQVNKQQLYY